jgi:hypothetical protein
VCGSRRAPRDFSGYCVVPNPLLETHVRMPPGAAPDGHHAHLRTSRIRISFVHAIPVCVHGRHHGRLSPLIARPSFCARPWGRTICGLGAQESQMRAHGAHAPGYAPRNSTGGMGTNPQICATLQSVHGAELAESINPPFLELPPRPPEKLLPSKSLWDSNPFVDGKLFAVLHGGDSRAQSPLEDERVRQYARGREMSMCTRVSGSARQTCAPNACVVQGAPERRALENDDLLSFIKNTPSPRGTG